MIVFPHAKINIGLHITGKRTDGYHNIETLFYPVGWSDIAEFIPSNQESSAFHQTGIPLDISAETENLIYKAYQLLQEDYALPPIHFHLHKMIPVGAGLGGGSSDAAYMVKALNTYFELQLSNDQLFHYASHLGSDCAFFLNSQPVLATGKGDRFTSISVSLAHYYIIIVYPGIHISTKEAYQGIQPDSKREQLANIIQSPVTEWHHLIQNDFEKTLLIQYPELEQIKNSLYASGAVYASLTGSGSAIYGIFREKLDLTHKFPGNYRIWEEWLT